MQWHQTTAPALEHWLLGHGKEKGEKTTGREAWLLGVIFRLIGNTHKDLSLHSFQEDLQRALLQNYDSNKCISLVEFWVISPMLHRCAHLKSELLRLWICFKASGTLEGAEFSFLWTTKEHTLVLWLCLITTLSGLLWNILEYIPPLVTVKHCSFCLKDSLL